MPTMKSGVMLNSTVDMVRCNRYKVLPLVYDQSLSYYEMVCKLAKKIDELEDRVSALEDQVQSSQN